MKPILVSFTIILKFLIQILDNKLTLKKIMKDTLNKSILVSVRQKRLHDILPGDSLVTTHKSFIRSHLDYGDVTYDQPNNESFSNKIEQLQCKACLPIPEAI